MVDINRLRQERAKAYEKLQALGDKAGSGPLSEDEQKEFDTLEASVKDLDKRIEAAERVQALRANAATPSPESIADEGGNSEPAASNPAPRAYPQAEQRPEPGVLFAGYTRMMAAHYGNVAAARAFAAQVYGDRHPITAALQSNEASGGGVLVPERWTQEFITLLTPNTVVRRNSRQMPLVGGTDNFPVVKSGVAGSYIGEGGDITTEEPTFGNLKLVERNLAVIVPVSNKLLRNASPNVDLTIRDLLRDGFAQTEDLYFLRGTGVGAAPKGLRYFAPAASVISANGTVNVTNIDADARKAELALLNHNVPSRSARWIMAPRVFSFLRDLRDGNGNLIYPGLSAARPTWKGYPVEVTTQIPINLGDTSNKTEVYLVAFDYCIVADAFNVRIEASREATYKEGGTLVSAFSRDQTVIRGLTGHDFGVSQEYAVAVITDCTWGA